MMSLLQQYFPFLRRVSLKEKAFFARQLSTMLDSGLPLAQALSIIGVQEQNEVMREVIASIVHDLEQGVTFSTGLAKHPGVFDRVFIAAVKSGEVSGKLDTVLEDLAKQLENEVQTVSKIKGALMYPVFILVAMVVVMIIMMMFIIPKMEPIFTENNVDLPIATKLLIGLSHSMTGFWWIYIIAIIFAIWGIRYYIRTDEGSERWNMWKIHAPLVGTIEQGIYMTRFTGTLAMLISAGVPIIEALKIVAEVMDNRIYSDSIYKVADEVSRGVPLSVPLQRDKNFPIIVSQMALVGEQTGKIDEVFRKLAKYYEMQTEEMTKGISSLLEPVVLVVMGIGVAFIVFSIIMPIYNLANKIS